jgi:hypothetical protein
MLESRYGRYSRNIDTGNQPARRRQNRSAAANGMFAGHES